MRDGVNRGLRVGFIKFGSVQMDFCVARDYPPPGRMDNFFLGGDGFFHHLRLRVFPGDTWSKAVPIRSGFPDILGTAAPGYLCRGTTFGIPWVRTNTSPASSNLLLGSQWGINLYCSRSCEKSPFSWDFRNFSWNLDAKLS